MGADSMTLGEIAGATGGRLLAGEPGTRVGSFSTDSRTLRPGDLFIALRGPNFDGHAFVAEAVAKGASAVLAGRADALPPPPLPPTILVGDTLRALGDLAARWRRGHGGRVAAVTGTNGKTTTKEMIRAILAEGFRTHASAGNLNNLVGVPQAILQWRRREPLAVFELAMSAPGEIGRLAEIARPDVGIITNIADAHLEFLGSREAVAAAKAELLPSLEGERTAILNRDDPFFPRLAAQVRGGLLTFGLDPEADFRAEGIRPIGAEAVAFTLRAAPAAPAAVEVRLPAIGRHNVLNALAAAAAGWAMGLDLGAASRGLGRASLVPMRMQRIRLPSGATVINDAYNANPASTEAAIGTFFEVRGTQQENPPKADWVPGPTILVLGDMLELGAHAAEAHRRVGEYLAPFGPDLVLTLGEATRATGAAAVAAGLRPEQVRHCRDHAEARALLREAMTPETWVLLKGSRGMRLEGILEGL